MSIIRLIVVNDAENLFSSVEIERRTTPLRNQQTDLRTRSESIEHIIECCQIELREREKGIALPAVLSPSALLTLSNGSFR